MAKSRPYERERDLRSDGVCVAWGWLDRGSLDVLTHPERGELLDEVLAWAEPDVVYTTEADGGKIARLEAAGYGRRSEGHVLNHMVQELGEIPAPALPDGYRLRTVRGEEDLLRRVEVHGIVWAPSRVVKESCLAWLDPANEVGLFEPVGTHPDHQRRGLATAVCLGALHSLRRAGARRALVGSLDPSDAEGLYEKVGFRTVTRHVPYGKKPADPVV